MHAYAVLENTEKLKIFWVVGGFTLSRAGKARRE
jgi:hypothetical protein